jgi:hypothetical protein
MKKIILLAIIGLFSTNLFAQTFAKYSAKVEKATAKSVNLSSHKDAKKFRTNLRNSLKEGVNYAGSFVISSWGCGTSCLQTAIIDGKTGNVFFPNILQGTSFGFGELSDKKDSIEFKKNSRLLVVNGYIARKNQTKYGIWYYEWTGKNLKLIKFVAKKSK